MPLQPGSHKDKGSLKLPLSQVTGRHTTPPQQHWELASQRQRLERNLKKSRHVWKMMQKLEFHHHLCHHVAEHILHWFGSAQHRHHMSPCWLKVTSHHQWVQQIWEKRKKQTKVRRLEWLTTTNLWRKATLSTSWGCPIQKHVFLWPVLNLQRIVTSTNPNRTRPL